MVARGTKGDACRKWQAGMHENEPRLLVILGPVLPLFGLSLAQAEIHGVIPQVSVMGNRISFIVSH